MIEIISDFLAEKMKNNTPSAVRRLQGMVCSLAGVFLNLIMFVLKLIASILTGSVAAAVDAVHNLTDSASSVVTLLSFFFADGKRTKKYPMGTGRLEYVAGFVVAIVLITAGFSLAKTSFVKIITPEPVTFSLLSVIMLVLSFLTKLYMAFFNRRISRKISSSALAAASVDCLCDSIATLIAALAVILVKFTSFNFDAWGGFAVSLFILFAGCKSAKDTVKMIVGIPVDDDFYDKVLMIFSREFPDIQIAGMMIHDYGPGNRILAVTVMLPEDGTADFLYVIQEKLSGEVAEKTGCELQTIIYR